jgi:hypothetical protein
MNDYSYTHTWRISSNQQRLTRAALAAGLVISGALAPLARAQSGDALIDKLVDKGILTVKEANELREEVDAGFQRAYTAKSGMPDWVTQMKLYGDVRGRYESFNMEGPTPDRNRFRYRLRTGLTVTMFDNIEAGMRLTSSEVRGDGTVTALGQGGDPISGNTTFGDNGSKKWIFLDLAYGKWTPINRNGWVVTGTVGKMENPFVTSDMEFDRDYTPEGAALQVSYQLHHDHILKLNGAGFALDEGRTAVSNPSMVGAQLRWDGKYLPREGYYLLESSLGLAGYALGAKDKLGNTAVPNINVGNTRNEDGLLVHNYNPIVVDASLTYNLVHAPLYNGTFPLRLEADYMYNPAAPDNNTGWWVGVSLGKAGKKRTWELAYRYKYLGADAWFEEFTDSDFGAYYAVAPANSLGGDNRYLSGTGVQGHIFKLAYAPYDSLIFSVTYFLTEVISQHDSGAGRLQVDAVWKF